MDHKSHKSKLERHMDDTHSRARMASVRLNTAEDPDRHERIAKKLSKRGSNMSVYGRELFDALERYIDEHDGQLPEIPLVVSPKRVSDDTTKD